MSEPPIDRAEIYVSHCKQQTHSLLTHPEKNLETRGSLQTTRPISCGYTRGLVKRVTDHHIVIINAIGWCCTALHCLLQQANKRNKYFHPCNVPICLYAKCKTDYRFIFIYLQSYMYIIILICMLSMAIQTPPLSLHYA